MSRSTVPGLVGRGVMVGFLAMAGSSFVAGGCAANHPVAQSERQWATTREASLTGLQPPLHDQDVDALCPIPAGWTADPLKKDSQRTHQTWLSPSRRTAYGVINFHQFLLPLASDPVIIDAVINAMKKTEGEARLIEWHSDPRLGGLRFVAEGGPYKVRGNVFRSGTEGWVVYAGTLRNQTDVPAELALAERAREHTQVGLPSANTAGRTEPARDRNSGEGEPAGRQVAAK